ncbi:MAG: hypothetical protein LUD27_05115, partial [Clostridia bacterium]|nr:hypothetical protein [Clostridia bacterium]
FAENGVRYYMVTYSDVNDGNEIEYRFVTSADSEAVKAAKETINTQINSLYILGGAQYTPYEAVLGGGNTLMYVGIALASVVAFQFLYFLIRYKLTMALAAFIADVHNLALFLSLLAITRVQVSSFVFALSVMVVILTMICCAILFDRMRKNFKTDEYKAMPSFEQSDAAANECLPLITTLNIALAAIIAIILVFATIGALSVYSLFMPCVAAILAVLVCEYGTMFFIPSVYSRLKLKADIHAENKAKKVKPEKSKKKDKPASADGALAK